MCETSDSLERSRSSSATLYFSEAERPGGLQSRGGVSLGGGPYAFEHGVAMPDTPSPQVAGGRRARRRRVRAPSLVVTRRSKLRRVSEARPAGRQEEEEENGNAPSLPARDDSFLNLWPCQSLSSSSSCSSSTSSALFTSEGEVAAANKPVGWPSGRRSKSDACGSLSFRTAKERAWLGPEAAAMEQSAPPSSRDSAGGDGEDEEARARGAQVEEDAVLARRLQEQFDRERPRQRCHHNQRGGQRNDTEPHDRELQQHEAQSPRSRQHSQNYHHGISSSSTEQIDNNALDLLPDSDCPWLAAVQWAAFSSMMNSHGGTDLTIGQPRGRGRGGGFRYAQLSDAFGGNQYEGLLDFGLRQVATKKKLNKREISVFPTKTYDPAQSAGNTRCQICFCDYACGEELRMLTCFHDYHVKCIDRWLKVNATCPVCRCNMAERQVPERSGMSPTPRSPTLTD